ncbi:response regulator [uncultured Roseobacter sp.]|uniref:response regulator n=1 Tax=uncultured Roseobacter sp. TaxID=114847 RepID=UPI0026365A0A|nr:response regulator [uncultured Roseobacter sp.]
MKVLIVEKDKGLAGIWSSYLQRCGMSVHHTSGQAEATEYLSDNDVEVIILNLVLGDDSALAVADYASYRQPWARVIFVTNTSFFSDGSIFSLAPNVCAFVPTRTPPSDLAAMVEHHAPRAEPQGPARR